MTQIEQQLKQLQLLDFSGKGESFVEASFLTPLLACLGYETHKDYEVLRHGDDGTSFKLSYPPVELGAVKVKHYNPDYVPTIRKKMFWVIEAKSPKEVIHPFDIKFLVQGLQYCIHPEIQAQYLLVSNGLVSSLFDAHGAVFLEKDMYQPVMEFRHTELATRWPQIYELLGVEKLRGRIEASLKATYDKLCLSSLNKDYPRVLLVRIGASSNENAQHIAKTVNRMYVEQLNADQDFWRKEMEGLSAEQAFAAMDDPLPSGPTAQAHYFLNKSSAEGKPIHETLYRLTHDYERQSIFRKEQSFLAACVIYLTAKDISVMTSAKAFLDKYKDADLPILNQVECALLRIARKSNVLRAYPKLREEISRALQSAPELTKFVSPPSALTMTYGLEVERHHQAFELLKMVPEAGLTKMLAMLAPIESGMEDDFVKARKKLSDSERQLLGFEIYGNDGKHYSFRNILQHYGIEQRPDSVHSAGFKKAIPKALTQP